MLFEVGQLLNNQFEVSYNAVTVEILVAWTDPDDNGNYYIVKCRKVDYDNDNRMYNAWYYEDEVDLVSEYSLDKYYRVVEA